jgi:hypothetical protein
MNKKRQMWVQVCCLFAVVWAVLGLFIWPLLILAVFSAFMILIPVGVSDSEPAQKHDPDAWRTDQNRPWGKR